MVDFNDGKSQAYFAKIRRVKKVNLIILCACVIVSLTLTVIVQATGKQDAAAQALLWIAIGFYCLIVAALVFDIAYPAYCKYKLKSAICEWVLQSFANSPELCSGGDAEFVFKKQESRAYLFRTGCDGSAQFDTSPFGELFLPENAAKYVKEYIRAVYLKNAEGATVTFRDETRRRKPVYELLNGAEADKNYFIKNGLI